MLSDNLKFFRKKCGYTQQLVANLLKMERSTYTYYELGKTQPNIANLQKLAKLYKISIDELITGAPYESLGSNSLLLSDNNLVYGNDNHITYLDKINNLCFDEKELVSLYRQLPEGKKLDLITGIKADLDRIE